MICLYLFQQVLCLLRKCGAAVLEIISAVLAAGRGSRREDYIHFRIFGPIVIIGRDNKKCVYSMPAILHSSILQQTGG
jgi:hypothetical protein